MNFIVCDGTWSTGTSGELLCSGTLVSMTGEEIQGELNPGLSTGDANMLIDATMLLFASVFVFLAMKKVI